MEGPGRCALRRGQLEDARDARAPRGRDVLARVEPHAVPRAYLRVLGVEPVEVAAAHLGELALTGNSK